MSNQSIVHRVCNAHGIELADFFGPKKTKHLIECRLAAMNALHDAGFNLSAISRLIKRNRTTVNYWMHPEYRVSRLQQVKRRMRRVRAARVGPIAEGIGHESAASVSH